MSRSGYATSSKCSYYKRFAIASLHHSLREGGPLIPKCSLQEEERRAELMARAKRKEEPWKWDEDAEEGRDDISWSGLSFHCRA